jgi:guanylate kinase
MRELGVSYGTKNEVVNEQQKVATGVLLVTDSKYKPIIRVTYHELYPTFISGIDFDSALTDTDAIIATTTFSYTYYEIDVLTNP